MVSPTSVATGRWSSWCITVPPSGGNGSMIPEEHVAGVRGRQDHAGTGGKATQPPRPKVVYTVEGKKAARMPSTAARPRTTPLVCLQGHQLHPRLDRRLAGEPLPAEDRGWREGHRHHLRPVQLRTVASTSTWRGIRTASSPATPATPSATGKAIRWWWIPWASPRACCLRPRATARRCTSSSASRSIRRSSRCAGTIR